MELTFNPNDRMRLFFDPLDRVDIDGLPAQPQYDNATGWTFSLLEGSGRAVQYTHEELRRLSSTGRLRVLHGHFRPESALRQLNNGTATPLSALAPKPCARQAKRSAYVNAFRELHGQRHYHDDDEGEISIRQDRVLKCTDASIKAATGELMRRAMQYHSRLRIPVTGGKIDKSADITIPPAPRTLRRWLADEGLLGEVGLVDQMQRRGRRTRYTHPAIAKIVGNRIRNYLSLEAPSMRIVHENIQGDVASLNKLRAEQGLSAATAPSYSTVCRMLHSLDRYQVYAARHGADAARKKFAPVSGGLALSRPIERLLIDEHRIHIVSLLEELGLLDYFTDEERKKLGLDDKQRRWCLTVAMCATTRCVLGMVFSRDPSARAALKVLQMALANKGIWADAVGAMDPWDMYGTPTMIVTDHGGAFKSLEFRRACADLDITLTHSPAGMPELRGTQERFFSTLNKKLMARLTGNTFSDIIKKGDADPTKRAALTFEDLAFALTRWIVDAYHNHPHEGLGRETPRQCWNRLVAEHGVRPSPDSRRWRLVFGEHLTRTLDQQGISVLGARYHSERLATWMIRNGEGKMAVRWHPRDLGAIEVNLGGQWYEIPAIDQRLQGVAAQSWLVANRNYRAANPRSKFIDSDVVFRAYQDIEARNAAAIALADLRVDDWSDDRVAMEERKLFIGFTMGSTAEAKVAENGVGRVIQVPEEAAPARKARAPSKPKPPADARDYTADE